MTSHYHSSLWWLLCWIICSYEFAFDVIYIYIDGEGGIWDPLKFWSMRMDNNISNWFLRTLSPRKTNFVWRTCTIFSSGNLAFSFSLYIIDDDCWKSKSFLIPCNNVFLTTTLFNEMMTIIYVLFLMGWLYVL